MPATGADAWFGALGETRETPPKPTKQPGFPDLLEQDQESLYTQAEQRQLAATVDVSTAAEALEAAATGWARLPWSELGLEGEARLAERSVTVRCLVRADGSLPETGDEPDVLAYCARAY